MSYNHRDHDALGYIGFWFKLFIALGLPIAVAAVTILGSL